MAIYPNSSRLLLITFGLGLVACLRFLILLLVSFVAPLPPPQVGNTGFSLHAAKKADVSSLVIGPGTGYNLVSDYLDFLED